MNEMPKVVLLHTRRTSQFANVIEAAGVQPPYDLRSYTINGDTYNEYNEGMPDALSDADAVVYEERLHDVAPSTIALALDQVKIDTSLSAYDESEAIVMCETGITTEAMK